MRDPTRIPKMIKILEQAWLSNPDMRLTQLISNAAHLGGWKSQSTKCVCGKDTLFYSDSFNCEDDRAEKGLNEICKKTIQNNFFIVIRRPCVQEDEGNYHIVGTFYNREKAEKWIQNQRGKYFGPDSYFIVEDSY